MMVQGISPFLIWAINVAYPLFQFVARVMAVKRQIHSEDADRFGYKKTPDFSGVHRDDDPNGTIL